MSDATTEISISAPPVSFGMYVKTRREALGKSIRGLAAELGMTAAYLSDIEHGNRYAPKNHLEKMIKALKIDVFDETNMFYDLAGQHNNYYVDFAAYVGQREVARKAIRLARDFNIPDSQWEDFIEIIYEKNNK